jgi:hypothetical protein
MIHYDTDTTNETSIKKSSINNLVPAVQEIPAPHTVLFHFFHSVEHAQHIRKICAR